MQLKHLARKFTEFLLVGVVVEWECLESSAEVVFTLYMRKWRQRKMTSLAMATQPVIDSNSPQSWSRARSLTLCPVR